MPSPFEGPLDSGKLEEVDLEKRSWSPSRISKWNPDIALPSILVKLTTRNKSLRRTAWLDGLRGFAALLVVWHHHQLWAHDATKQTNIFENAWGYQGKYYFVALPFVRSFFAGGHFAVTIFFVVSGYCLSTKALTYIHAGESGKAGDAVGSSLFRRWLRLYLPVLGTTFVYMTSWHLFGLWTADSDPKRKETYGEELWDYYLAFKSYSWVFNGGDFLFRFNFHVWSIPVEFRGSIIVYTALLAFSKVSRNVRLWGQVFLIWYFLYMVDGWYGALFMSGMLLADLDLLAVAGNLPSWFYRVEPYKELIFFHLFIVSMYLGGVPSFYMDMKIIRNSPGWIWLSYLKPIACWDYKWFFLFWAASLMVACIPRLPWLKHFFEIRFNQYLGRISYSMYLVHGPVLWVLGDRLYTATGWTRDTHDKHIPEWINAFPMSKAGPLGLEPSFLAPLIILFPVTIWMAEMVTRLFDEPSVQVSNWLYKKALAPPPQAKA